MKLKEKMKRKAQIELEKVVTFVRGFIDSMKRDPNYYKLSDSSLATEGFWKLYYLQDTEEKKFQIELFKNEVSRELNTQVQDKDSVVNVPAGTFSAEWYTNSAKAWIDTAFTGLEPGGIIPYQYEEEFAHWLESNIGRQVSDKPIMISKIRSYLDSMGYPLAEEAVPRKRWETEEHEVAPLTEEEESKLLDLLADFQKKEREGTITDEEKKKYEEYKKTWSERRGVRSSWYKPEIGDRVRIVDISSRDGYFGNREKLIGKTGVIQVEWNPPHQSSPEWGSCVMALDDRSMGFGGPTFFYAVKLEPAEYEPWERIHVKLSNKKRGQLEPMTWNGMQGHRHPNGGGFVADTAHVDGTVYVGLDAKVYGYAEVYDNAKVSSNAKVYGNAKVFGNAIVCGDAKVYGNAKVCGDALVYGNADVFGTAKVYGNAEVYGNAHVYDNAQVYGYAEVYDNAKVSGNADVFGNA